MKFKRVNPTSELLRFRFEGIDLTAYAGDSVAAAILGAGQSVLGHNPSTSKPRGPFCMMGSCYECLVEIDGVSVQACQVLLTDGMNVRSVAAPETDGENTR